MQIEEDGHLYCQPCGSETVRLSIAFALPEAYEGIPRRIPFRTGSQTQWLIYILECLMDARAKIIRLAVSLNNCHVIPVYARQNVHELFALVSPRTALKGFVKKDRLAA